MTVYFDECVGCPPEIGCMGNSCPYKNVKHVYCDKCERECINEEYYEYENQILCEGCFSKVTSYQNAESEETK